MAKTNIKKAKAAAKAAKTEQVEKIETVENITLPEVETLVEAPKVEEKTVKAEKAETKTEAKKAPAKKTASKTSVKVVVEYQGRQVNQEDILASVQAAAGKAKSLEIYIKPEDGAVYFVADGETGKVDF